MEFPFHYADSSKCTGCMPLEERPSHVLSCLWNKCFQGRYCFHKVADHKCISMFSGIGGLDLGLSALKS